MVLISFGFGAKLLRFDDKKDKKDNVLVINKMSLSFLSFLSSHEMVSAAPMGLGLVGWGCTLLQGLHSATPRFTPA